MSSKKVKHQKNYFNKISDEYEKQNELSFEFMTKLSKLVSPYIKGNVLDIGNGGLVYYDISKATSLTIADLAAELLANPKKLHKGKFVDLKKKNLKIVEADVMDLPFQDESFDVVTMFNVAHHLSVDKKADSKKNVEKAFSEIYRVLKKDGLFVLHENCPSIYYGAFQSLFYEYMFHILERFGKPLPHFYSVKFIKKTLIEKDFFVGREFSIEWSDRVYQPVFPMFAPPRWLWNLVLKNELLLCKK